jgi:hypothetical protein
MLHKDTQVVYCYNPEEPIQVGMWDKEKHSVCFMEGALDALHSGEIERLRNLHQKSSDTV